MARSRAKQSDQPAIAMRIEQGRLVPISQYDQELLAQWRDGAILNIEPTLAETRVMERRYFAMLSKLLKVASTPWSNVPAAHVALKEMTGFTLPYRKKDGGWDVHERSIATFTDAELAEYFELFCGIVRTKFDIDPDTLRKEAPDIESPGRLPPEEAGDAPDADPIPAGVGVPNSEEDSDDESSPEVGPSSEGDEPKADGEAELLIPLRDSPSARGGLDHPLSSADLAWLKMAARMLVAATAQGGGVEDAGIIDRQVIAIKSLTPADVSAKAKSVAQQIYRHCIRACVDNEALDKRWIAAMAGCEESDLRPEAR